MCMHTIYVFYLQLTYYWLVVQYTLHLPLARARVTVPRHKGSSECARSDRVQMLGAMGIE